ncbi:hypothetical protein SO802_024110 [Lithocarpus litseifolius]|uniref:Zinc finger CCCH domain-containing protein 48-like n=1 Tax=Lithocarpus litseifolius TaxID=425828 RepID=A0AAW2C8I1_9ROSI
MLVCFLGDGVLVNTVDSGTIMVHSMSLVSTGLIKFGSSPHIRVSCGRHGLFNLRSSPGLLCIRAVQENGGPRRLVDIIRVVPELSRNYFRSPSRRALFGGISLLGGFYVAQTISLSFGALGVNDVIAAVVCVLLTEYATKFYYSRPKCQAVIQLGGEVGCMINEGHWVFVGIPNAVKAWNTLTNSELSLSGPVGQVYAMVVGNDLLFAGTQDGSILAWKFNAVTNTFEPVASLRGHTLGVVSLVVGANRLYSGSMDCSIRVWNLETLQCVQTLKEHSSVVMSVLCWDQFLLSCSLDKTIKVWVATESGNLEVTYTHNEEHGLLTLCGMHDLESKPILLCSCNDNTVHLYDLPSFSERGKIYSKQEVRAIQMGPGGLFFTGDGAGQVKVWRWLPESTATTR